MKKIITLALFIFVGTQPVFTQFEVVGSEEYGRLFDVTYDPNEADKLYAITLGNHIMTSLDNGLSWDILYSFPEQSSAIDGLRYLDGNQLSFYIKYSSTKSLIILDINTLNVEKEFVLPIPPNSDDNWIASYDVFETNTDIAIIHQEYRIGFSNYAKVYYTADGGATFQEIYYNGDYDDVFPNNVAIHPSNPSILYIARGNGPTSIDGGLFKSVDAGTSWVEHLPGNTFKAIAFHPQNPDTILLGTSIGYGQHVQNLYQSTDGGNNWSIIPITWTDETLNNITFIRYNPNNPDNVIVLEENEIVITNDGFTTWQNFVYTQVDVHSYYYGLNASFNPFNHDEVFISSNFHVLFSEDGGETMSWAKNPYFTSTGTVNIFNNQQESHLYYGVQFGYIHRDMQSLQEAPYEVKPLDYFSNSPGITVFTDITLPGRVYTFEGSFLGSNLYYTDNHGQNREIILNIFSSLLHAVSSFPSNPNIIWASFSDFGSNPELLEIDFTDLNNIQITSIALPLNDIVTDIYIHPQNPNERMISIGTRVFITINGGMTWDEYSNGLSTLLPFDDLIFKISPNPFNQDQFSLATSKGIFSTLNGGLHWEQKTTAVTHNISHSSVNNGHLIAASHNSPISDFSLKYSNDGGENWSTVSSENLHYVSSSTTAFHFFGNYADVYIGTYDLGLVKYTLNLSSLNSPDFNITSRSLQLYPNPVKEILYINAQDEIIQQIRAYSITGQKVIEQTGVESINLAFLEQGVYIVKVITGSGKHLTGKFIKI